MTQLTNHNIGQTIHVRFGGRSEELTTAMLNLDPNANDIQIKQAIIAHFDLPAHTLDNHAVVRTSAAIIVRPEAVYG